MEKELAEVLGFSVFMGDESLTNAHVVDVQTMPNFNSEGSWLVAIDYFSIDMDKLTEESDEYTIPPKPGQSPCRMAYLVADHLIVPLIPGKKGWNSKGVEESIEDLEGAKGFIEDTRKAGIFDES